MNSVKGFFPPPGERVTTPAVFDAFGNQLFPAPPPPPHGYGHHCAVCRCDGGPARPREVGRLSPGAAVAVGAGGVLVVGVVLVALLLSVAVVAASVAVAALSLTVVAVVLRSILNGSQAPRPVRRR
ncbi:hypothetical protein GCM10010218_24500 [Streptomyces mashuensis]|uniref:SpdD protein n=1 Tax=Streptomyces mashuensis TaxID=33904 RepID=A0A919ED62_9ACTN|nr:hypothetical protein [Streptomyces mashuensis]GHF42453.1 hypothetical protein GCM10010218_24500 [Streptomyces mashuensis]